MIAIRVRVDQKPPAFQAECLPRRRAMCSRSNTWGCRPLALAEETGDLQVNLFHVVTVGSAMSYLLSNDVFLTNDCYDGCVGHIAFRSHLRLQYIGLCLAGVADLHCYYGDQCKYVTK